jgi:hypothetical protein
MNSVAFPSEMEKARPQLPGFFTLYFYFTGQKEILGQLSLDIKVHSLPDGKLVGLDRAYGQLKHVN